MRILVLKNALSYYGKGIKCVKGIPVPVEDHIADELMETGHFEEEDTSVPDFGTQDGNGVPDPDTLFAMKKEELSALAVKFGVDIKGCRTNEERANKIQDALVHIQMGQESFIPEYEEVSHAETMG